MELWMYYEYENTITTFKDMMERNDYHLLSMYVCMHVQQLWVVL